MKLSKIDVIKLHFRGTKELHKINPQFFSILLLKSVLSAWIPYVTVFFSAQILNQLIIQSTVQTIGIWTIGGIITTGALAMCHAFFHQRYETLYDDLWGRKQILYSEKMFSMDFADIDKQETHDLLAQIKQNEQWTGWGLARIPHFMRILIESSVGIFSGMVLTIGLFRAAVPKESGVLTFLNHPLFVFLFAAMLIGISVLSGKFYAKSVSYWGSITEEGTLANRLFEYFGFIGTKKDRAEDLRMYHQQNLISAYWKKDMLWSSNGVLTKIAKGPMGIYSGLGLGVSAVITGGIYTFSCLKAWAGAFGIGDITRYVGAATAMASNIRDLLEVLGNMKTNAPYLEIVFEFLDISNAMYQGSLTTEKRADRQYEIEFKNVSFQYPGSERWALKNLSMKFRVGRRLAVVGENGSGKTTFIKLLCRLYDPQEGQILLNGIDIRKYHYPDYMGLFSVVFQDFQLMSQPLGNNVAGSMVYDERKVLKALSDAGFDECIKSMPEGLDTWLYKEYTENGVEISGGEAQKIAIARALYKNAPFIILDEPTAALDPIAEAEIYAKLNEIIDDKTAVYISHRLSSCKFCDEILVFHEGKMIQQGSHEVLLAENRGKYYELWQAQAQYYQVGV